MFIDLVGSTELSEELDPEDLFEVFQSYRDHCSAPIKLYGGKIMKFLGDGIVACFGYPTPIENSAQSAASAALDIQSRFEAGEICPGTPELAIRIGIHSGSVVISDFQSVTQDVESDSIVGVVPNLAARLQGKAEPGEIVISAATRDLLGPLFLSVSLGTQSIRGIREPQEIFRLEAAPDIAAQAQRYLHHQSRPLVGRAEELRILVDLWRNVVGGGESMVMISGEAGAGKTRLLAELKSSLADDEKQIATAQCIPVHQDAYLYPLQALILRLLNLPSDAPVDTIRESLQEKSGSCAEGETPDAELLLDVVFARNVEGISPEAWKKGAFAALRKLIEAVAIDRPLLIEFADVHWIDPSSMEFLNQLIRTPVKRVLLVVSARPNFVHDWSAELSGGTLLHVRVGALDAGETRIMAENVAGGKTLPREVIHWVYRTTSGIPLFIEQLMLSMLRSGSLDDKGSFYDLGNWASSDLMPDTLRDLLAVRLDHLGEALQLARTAAVIGPTFSYQLLRVLWVKRGFLRDDFTRHFEKLVEEGMIIPVSEHHGDEFAFSHILFQRAAYNSMLKLTRKPIHQALANYFLVNASKQVSIRPSLMVMHLTAGERFADAIPWYLEAAQNAISRSAHAECVSLCNQGMEILSACEEESQRLNYEMMLISLKMTSSISMRGHASAEVANCMQRAVELSNILGDHNPVVFPVISGMWAFNLMSGNLDACPPLAERILRAGEKMDGPHWALEGHMSLGVSLYWRGELEKARSHLIAATELYDEETYPNTVVMGRDGGVATYTYLTFVHCYLGEFEEAFHCQERARVIARNSGHPSTMAWALGGETMFQLGVGNLDGTIEVGLRSIQFCKEQVETFWMLVSQMMVGWAKTQKGEVAEGIAMFEDAFARYALIGANLTRPVFLTMLADCRALNGDFDEAFEHIESAISTARENAELLSLPGVLTAKAALILRSGSDDYPLAETLFREAIELANSQMSRLRSLQAASGLARIYRRTGRDREADELIADSRRWIDTSSSDHVKLFATRFFSALQVD